MQCHIGLAVPDHCETERMYIGPPVHTETGLVTVRLMLNILSEIDMVIYFC